MAITVYADAVVKTALAQVGKSCGKTNEYSAELDKVNFYNGKKNGIADSCSIFVDWCVYKNTSPQTAHNARSVLYEPDVDNCGAGVVFAAQYFKAHKAWIDGKDAAKAKVGDKVIFAADKYKKKANPYGYYHTGVVVAVDTKNQKITTVEGNTNGGKVAKKTYSFSNSVIVKGGFGRPKYSESPSPTPPEPPKPTNQYTVHTNSGDALRLRAEPNTTSTQTGYIDNGTTFTSDKVVEGQDVGGVNTWVYYKCGYASGKYLTPTPVLTTASEPVEKPTEPSEPIVEPTPIPEPAKPATPTPAPVKKVAYKVKTKTGLSLRLRNQKNTDCKVLTTIPNGTIIYVEKTSGGWAYTTYNGKSGWCALDRLVKV